MIETNTGAKKIEGSDGWREIFDVHNDSVEAHDNAIESLCQTISGTTNNCGHTINSGEYFIANGGKYKATASIPVNQAWSGSAQPVSDNDLVNALNNSIASTNNRISTLNTSVIEFYGFTLGQAKAITGKPYNRYGIAFGVWATNTDSQKIIPFFVPIPANATALTIAEVTLYDTGKVTSGTYDVKIMTWRAS